MSPSKRPIDSADGGGSPVTAKKKKHEPEEFEPRRSLYLSFLDRKEPFFSFMGFFSQEEVIAGFVIAFWRDVSVVGVSNSVS